MIKKLFKNMTVAIAALFIALVALPQAAQAQVYATVEAYVVEDGTTLTFYYDYDKESRTGTVYDIDDKHSEAGNYPAWAGYVSNFNTRIVNVVFDSSFKNYKPTTTRAWFYNCTALQTIEGIENLNTEEVTDMFGMFCGCKELTSIDLSNFNTSNVTDMYRMFYHCSALTSLDVSKFNVAKVTVMAGMFGSCQSLTTIYCNDDWNSNTLDSSSNMFHSSTKLVGAVAYDASKTDVTMANPTTGYFTMKTLEAYVVEEGTTLTFYYDGNKATRTGTVYGIDDKHPKDANIPAWAGRTYSPNERITNVVFDSSFKDYKPTTTNSWFSMCTNIETIEGMSNLVTDQVTDMTEMFYFCSSLTSIDLSNFNTTNVTDMTGMFRRCSALTTLDAKLNTANVESMQYMFAYCSSLTSLDLSNFNTANVESMQYMFAYCSSLTSLDVSKFNTANVNDMSCMFVGCSSLNSLDVSKFNTANVNDMSCMFEGCSSLTSLDVSKFNTANVYVIYQMFYDCSSLATIYCNADWRTMTVTDSDNMFTGCTNLVGAVAYDANKVNIIMANPTTGYFTKIDDGAVDEIVADANAPVMIYNLNGIKVGNNPDQLEPGIYIVRQGTSVKKIAISR